MRKRMALICGIISLVCVFGACSRGITDGDQGDNNVKVSITDAPNSGNGQTQPEEVSAGVTDAAATTANVETEDRAEQLRQKYANIQYVIPEAIAESAYDMKEALTCIPLKEACEPYFKFGMAMTGYAPSNLAVESPEMRELLKYHCNTTTMTNLMKPMYMLDRNKCIESAKNGDGQPAINFTTADKVMAFCQENNIGLRGHTLVWHAQTPDWFFREGYKDDGSYVDADTMKMRLESYIRQMITHCQENYPGVVYCWDVVNEAVEVGNNEQESGFRCRTKFDGSPDGDNTWYKVLGYEYVELAFTYARKYADPGVSLIYNDYFAEEPNKARYIRNLLAKLQEKNLVDGIGIQGGQFSTSSKMFDVYDVINKYADMGLEIQITELSISMPDTSEESYNRQADIYRSLMNYLMLADQDNGGKANITVVNIFSLMDGYLFYPDDKNTFNLFDKNIKPKPCYEAIIDVVLKKGELKLKR